jgi:phosphoadenosine phosphosulfate reductase
MLDVVEPASAESVLTRTVNGRFKGTIALVSSFGTESAILLHMISEIDKTVPIIFLDTGKLFAETLAYRDELVTLLGLVDVRSVRPGGAQLAAWDPDGRLWEKDVDLCCAVRKTNPLDAALEGFDAWITGRKRAQGAARSHLNLVETGPDGRVTVNPLAHWDDDMIETYFQIHDLPRHPLQAQGYTSIGCATCTARPSAGEDKRSGRWAGRDKTECGIHLPRPEQYAFG